MGYGHLHLQILKETFTKKSVGGKAFRVCSPKLRNKLPENIKASTGLDGFKNSLKDYFKEKPNPSRLFAQILILRNIFYYVYKCVCVASPQWLWRTFYQDYPV